MATFAAAILDELMGRDRNSNPDEKRKELNWNDHETCKHYLCGFCPAILFQNTRADIGICNKIHEDELAKSYQGSSRYMKMGYEEEFLLYLQQILAVIDRNINKNISRLSYNASHAKELALKAQEDRINKLTEKINSFVEKVEELGNMGEVDEAQSTMRIVDTLKSERTQQELAMSSLQPVIMIKEMEVCQVCGAFLVVGDAQQRIEEHLAGKLHMGYAKVRATIPILKEKLDAYDEERRKKKQERRMKEEEDLLAKNNKHNEGKSKDIGGSNDRFKDRSKERSHSTRKRSASDDKKDKLHRDYIDANGHIERKSKDRKKRDKDRDSDKEYERDREKNRKRNKDRSKDDYRDKSKERERHRDKERERSKDKSRHRHKDRSQNRHRDRDRSRDIDIHKNKDRNRSRDKEREKNRRHKEDKYQRDRDDSGKRDKNSSSRDNHHKKEDEEKDSHSDSKKRKTKMDENDQEKIDNGEREHFMSDYENNDYDKKMEKSKDKETELIMSDNDMKQETVDNSSKKLQEQEEIDDEKELNNSQKRSRSTSQKCDDDYDR